MKLLLLALALAVTAANAAQCPQCTEAVCTAANTANSNTLLVLKAASDFPAAGCTGVTCTVAECCQTNETCQNIANTATAVAATQTSGCGGTEAATGWKLKTTLPTTRIPNNTLVAAGANAKRLACCDITVKCSTGDGSGQTLNQTTGCGHASAANSGWTIKGDLTAVMSGAPFTTGAKLADLTANQLRLQCCDMTAKCSTGNSAGAAVTQAMCGHGTPANAGYTLKVDGDQTSTFANIELKDTAYFGVDGNILGGTIGTAITASTSYAGLRAACCKLTAKCNDANGAGAALTQTTACGGAVAATGWTIKTDLNVLMSGTAYANGGAVLNSGVGIQFGTSATAATRISCCDFTASCNTGHTDGSALTQTTGCGGTVDATGYTIKATLPTTAITGAPVTAGRLLTAADKKAICCDEGPITCAKTTVVTTSAVAATQNTHCGGAYGTPPAAGAWKLKATLPTTAISGVTLASTGAEKAAAIKAACCTQECTPIAVSPAGVAAPGIFAALLAAVAAALRM